MLLKYLDRQHKSSNHFFTYFFVGAAGFLCSLLFLTTFKSPICAGIISTIRTKSYYYLNWDNVEDRISHSGSASISNADFLGYYELNLKLEIAEISDVNIIRDLRYADSVINEAFKKLTGSMVSINGALSL
jgi:hypothetical protein